MISARARLGSALHLQVVTSAASATTLITAMVRRVVRGHVGTAVRAAGGNATTVAQTLVDGDRYGGFGRTAMSLRRTDSMARWREAAESQSRLTRNPYVSSPASGHR